MPISTKKNKNNLQMKKIFIFSIIFYFFLGSLYSQINFVASASKVVELGENFRLNFSVNANASNFNAPDLSNFQILAGPNPSTSTSFQFINGKTTQSINISYSYILQAKKEGKFTIGKANINVDGKVYSSAPITIEVIKGGTGEQANTDDQHVDVPKGNNDIFVQTNLDRTSVYQGEQIIATIKIYDRAGLKDFTNFKFPSFTGFYSLDIERPTQISLERENVNGKIYNTGILKQNILFPQHDGTLTIEPCEMKCIIQQKAGQRRNFFGELVDVYRDVEISLKSNARSVKVLPLPDNAPPSFSGAVGSNFNLVVNVDKAELLSNESVTLKVILSGNGNLKTIDKLKLNFPASFEVYDPKINSNIHNSTSGCTGSNTYEYLIIPREPGEYTIPPIEFSYFDVSTKTYKVLKSKEINFKIGKGQNSPNTVTGVNQESVKQLGSDIRYIKQNNFELKKVNNLVFGSLFFYLSYIIALIIFLAVIIILRKRIKQNKNLGLIKNKRANKISQKRLKSASLCMQKGEKLPFYDEVIKALWGYLSDKLNIPVSSLSREAAREELAKSNVNETVINEFIQVIDSCEFAKYAPATAHDQIEQDFERARKIINKLEQVLS